MDPPPLRVVIADDSALIREGIARLIEESGGSVVAKVGDGDAFVAAIVDAPARRLRGRRPDAADAARRGPARRHRSASARPGTPILVLSQYVERQYATELLAGGAAGSATCSRTASVTSPSSWTPSAACPGRDALDPEVVAS